MVKTWIFSKNYRFWEYIKDKWLVLTNYSSGEHISADEEYSSFRAYLKEMFELIIRKVKLIISPLFMNLYQGNDNNIKKNELMVLPYTPDYFQLKFNGSNEHKSHEEDQTMEDFKLN